MYTQIINWSYVLCKGFAYDAENPALIFIPRIYLVRLSKVDLLKIGMK